MTQDSTDLFSIPFMVILSKFQSHLTFWSNVVYLDHSIICSPIFSGFQPISLVWYISDVKM